MKRMHESKKGNSPRLANRKANFSILSVLVLALSGLLTLNALPSAAQEHGVKKFGVYEAPLRGDGSVANPFDTMATVTFTPPSGQAKAITVHAFYDGDNIWRARVYVSETGAWRWSSACATDKGLGGKTGAFKALDSKLRGRLLPHPRNPRHWITEDGRWFLNLNDTAYFLLCKYDGYGQPIPFEDFTAYVRDAVAHGITSFRSWAFNGPKPLTASANSDRHRWYDLFADEALTRFRVDNLQQTDRRLQWMLDNYPDVYVQFILFPLGTPWRRDSSFWAQMNASQKERVMRYLLARYAAYPQLFWLIVNDAHYAPDKLGANQEDVAKALREAKYPNNIALAREVGAYFRQHDPWQHPLSTGHARTVPFQFGDEDWATYIHLEDQYDLGAQAFEPYYKFARPVFLGEDRYEQDRPDRDPIDMRYFQRRLFWAWLLAGGSTNYGGRWWPVHPYTQAGKRATPSPWYKDIAHKEPLTGLDSVRFIRDYFSARKIELSDFEPDHRLVGDPDQRAVAQQLKLMRRGTDEYLIYHPNAAGEGRETKPDTARRARLRLDLREAHGRFTVEWYRAEDGLARKDAAIEGGGEIELISPFTGHDVVLRLRKNARQ
ncbi:MAG: DUF5060 domain-containing protein [Acidobacteriota bacterium]